MLSLFSRLATAMLMIGSIQGCFLMQQTFTRNTLKNEGLVVAEVYKMDLQGNITPISGKASFDTTSVANGAKTGYLVVSLAPGKHKLQSITSVSGSLTTTYSFNLEFEIRAGSVTSLGKLILLTDAKLGLNRYRVLSVENNKHILKHIKQNFPEAFGSIGNQVIKPDFKQLAAKDFKTIQMEITRRKLVMGRNTLQLSNRDYIVYGDLGALVKYSMSKDLKKFDTVKVLSTRTQDSFSACDLYKSTVACLANSHTDVKVVINKGNKVISRKLNRNNSFSQLFFGPKGELVLINNQFEILRSRNLGKIWSQDKRFFREQKTTKPLKLAQGQGGFFLFLKQEEAPVLKFNERTGKFSKIDITFDEDHLTEILETRNGIYVGPEYTLMSNARLYYQENAKSTWQEIEVPYSNCTTLKSLDKGLGKKLQMSCEYGKKVTSKDGGKSWYLAGQ